MNKFSLVSVGLIPFLVPATAVALGCSTHGATIVYVNGIETTQEEADNDAANLHKLFLEYGGSLDVQIITGYNPTHLDGLGDELESISQAFGTPVSNYDLDTILTQIASEVTTHELLLVGHSQGAFYTNELYDYLVRNGVPQQSVAVYDIATPASYVAGGGTYLTSANDKVINYVRQLDAEANIAQALPANIIIPEEVGYAATAWGGHFPDVYLDGAPERIVSDLQHALGSLSPGQTSSGACFLPPTLGPSYSAQKAIFSAADPMVADVDYAAIDARNTLASVNDNANDIIHTAFADAYFSVFPEPDVQSAAGVFAVEKALYGSSLSVADYEALANGQDIPEVQMPTQDPPQIQEAVAKTVPQPLPTKPTEAVQVAQSNAPSTSTPPSALAPISISPGFGGGTPADIADTVATVPSQIYQDASSTMPVSQPEQLESASSSATTTEQEGNDPQPTATTTLSVSVISPMDQAVLVTTTVEITGTTSPSTLVFANFGTTSASTTSDGAGNWSFAFELPVGTTTLAFSAADQAGDHSATSTLAVIVALPAVSEGSPMTSAACPSIIGGGYFFDPSYEQAEYVDGLLRLHLRLLTPFNDGRFFRAQVLAIGSDCTFPAPSFGFGFPQTWLPAHIQYYSLRMSSSTHWILWDDENDVQATCDVCEGDIPNGTSFVSFYAIIDSGASSVRTTPYPPTSP